MQPLSELPVPSFYEPERAGEWSYSPDQGALFSSATEWRRRHGIRPWHEDRLRVHLLLVDLQRDFCLPQGSLFVGGRSGTGAVDDSDRITRFVYRNLHRITGITCTLDTHHPFQIFFPCFWLDRGGRRLAAHTELSSEEVRDGEVQPDPAVAEWLCGGDQAWLRRQVEFYCEQLEAGGKYRLHLWPYHCLQGSDGHSLVGVVHEARLFHAWARGCESRTTVKGEHPLTESYSALGPEVLERHDGGRLAEPNTRLLDELLSSDAVLVAGQASSHCVKATLEDLLAEIRSRDPSLADRVYVLEDCTSAVTVPDAEDPGRLAVDFTPQAEEALGRFADAGVHLVQSTEASEWWPEP
jgi:nicotinamidase-related amidase